METSDHTRALVRAYRSAVEPPPGALERQHARLLARLAAAPPAPRRRVWTLVVAIAALLALAIGGLGFYIDARIQRAVDASLAERGVDRRFTTGIAEDQAPPPGRAPSVVGPDPVVAPAPAPGAPPLAPEPTPGAPPLAPEPATFGPVVAPAAAGTAAVAPPRRRPRSRASVVDADDLQLEGALLSQARDALTRGEWSRVLNLVDEHRRQHPHGALLEERLVLEAAAACESGQPRRGQAALRALRRGFPGSLALTRIATACAQAPHE